MATVKLQLVGRHVGNWELLRLLGEGSFGAVYEVQNRTIDGRRAAVKILHPELSVQSDIKRRFLNEASAASRADHENIIQVFDAGVTDDGLYYLVMELLRGQSLAQLLQAGPLSPHRTVHVGLQIASALQAAHDINIVHRDLKPDNIFLTSRTSRADFVKVLDFGIAKLWGQDGHTKTGMWLGTPAYMSPEQWKTLPDIDGRADLYSLGVILFQCLTGRLPFSGNTPYEWLNAHLGQPLPALVTPGPVPSGLVRCVQRLLAKERADRHQTAAEVITELQQCITAAGPPGALQVVPDRARPTVPMLAAAGPQDAARGGAAAPQLSTMRQSVGQVGTKAPVGALRRWALGGGIAAALALGAGLLLLWPRLPASTSVSDGTRAAARQMAQPSPDAEGIARAPVTTTAKPVTALAVPAGSPPEPVTAPTEPVTTRAAGSVSPSSPLAPALPPGAGHGERRAGPALSLTVAGLTITSRPPGATVRLDGKNGAVLGVTPLPQVALTRGLHTLSFWLEGYEVGVLDVDVQRPREVFRIELRPKPSPVPAGDSLRNPFGR